MNKLKAILCVLVGHSRIVEMCWGQVTCARCGDVVGDTLVGACDLVGRVVMEHDCETCREVWDELTWRDRLLAPGHGAVFAKP